MTDGKAPSEQEQLVGRVESMKALVEYQDGSVVSRTIIKKPTGTVTLFAFAKGESLSEHTTPYDALVQLLDGKAEFRIAGEPHTVTAGEMILLPASVPHAVQAVEPFKMVLTMIRS
jgi:quercetin dioxygenase-like cupin family protein